ncbi:hypothetical protein [Streptomyces cahuitamycinicus]|uniref:Uncharacterized protein n=1 Tax=Streptomyces cahuitamycinicus TaxID=2070367 RepID=A0A2N8TF50_9ACTN|nr:hypothetical protein [Streptomyces cahuitamycinicus]PNG17594.1 hypothetical protein C1J00_35695 [Streptomyces cahuitamycinicus]
MTTATHLRTIALRWTDLQTALATTGTATWPPAGRMSDYLRDLDDADAELAEAARWQAAYNRKYLDRDPTQVGATRPPLRIEILDTMRTVEARLTETGDQVAAAVQRSPMTFAPRGWPAADRARRDALARADTVDPRRWRYGGRHTAPHTALWLLARVQGRPGPFRPLPEREGQLIADVAREACARVENALDIADRTAVLATPCPRMINVVFPCGGRIEMYGGAGAEPVAHCTECGHIWTGQDAAAVA